MSLLIPATYYGNTAEDCRHIIASYLTTHNLENLLKSILINIKALRLLKDGGTSIYRMKNLTL